MSFDIDLDPKKVLSHISKLKFLYLGVTLILLLIAYVAWKSNKHYVVKVGLGFHNAESVEDLQIFQPKFAEQMSQQKFLEKFSINVFKHLESHQEVKAWLIDEIKCEDETEIQCLARRFLNGNGKDFTKLSNLFNRDKSIRVYFSSALNEFVIKALFEKPDTEKLRHLSSAIAIGLNETISEFEEISQEGAPKESSPLDSKILAMSQEIAGIQKQTLEKVLHLAELISHKPTNRAEIQSLDGFDQIVTSSIANAMDFLATKKAPKTQEKVRDLMNQILAFKQTSTLKQRLYTTYIDRQSSSEPSVVATLTVEKTEIPRPKISLSDKETYKIDQKLMPQLSFFLLPALVLAFGFNFVLTIFWLLIKRRNLVRS